MKKEKIIFEAVDHIIQTIGEAPEDKKNEIEQFADLHIHDFVKYFIEINKLKFSKNEIENIINESVKEFERLSKLVEAEI